VVQLMPVLEEGEDRLIPLSLLVVLLIFSISAAHEYHSLHICIYPLPIALCGKIVDEFIAFAVIAPVVG